MYYDLIYILFDWKLGWWEIGAKIFVFQEIYETLLYLLAPFVIPISFATRPGFAAEIYIATIVMYIFNALIFNYVSLFSNLLGSVNYRDQQLHLGPPPQPQ